MMEKTQAAYGYMWAATPNPTYSPIVPYFTENNTLYSHYSVITGTLRHGDYPNHESLYVLT